MALEVATISNVLLPFLLFFHNKTTVFLQPRQILIVEEGHGENFVCLYCLVGEHL